MISPHANILFISELNRKELWQEFRSSIFGKWSTTCLLRHLGLRVLDSVFIPSQSEAKEVHSAVNQFCHVNKIEKVMIRTDGGVEQGDYIRGGNSVDASIAADAIMKITVKGRAVIMMVPTNRLNNLLTVNLGIGLPDSFEVEVLGPGFDLSDLNRGLVVPEVSISAMLVGWREYSPPHPLLCTEHRITKDVLGKMKTTRLRRIATELLPAAGIEIAGDEVLFAKRWLTDHGCSGLFSDDRPRVRFKLVSELYDIAFLIANSYGSVFDWDSLAIGASDLGDGGGLVYWDIVNPGRKFRLSGL